MFLYKLPISVCLYLYADCFYSLCPSLHVYLTGDDEDRTSPRGLIFITHLGHKVKRQQWRWGVKLIVGLAVLARTCCTQELGLTDFNAHKHQPPKSTSGCLTKKLLKVASKFKLGGIIWGGFSAWAGCCSW